MATMGWDEVHFLTDWAVLAESLNSGKQSLELPHGPACALTQRKGRHGRGWLHHRNAHRSSQAAAATLYPPMKTRLEDEAAWPVLL